ncbi:MAG TPA: glycine--tRNA ligase subunit beta, partial [Buchnera sp. (in: enterobacteria)]|nr:glycine--tRNA ligase subunit beta [Buchnera sp. (in: enterobacteria)]
MQKTLLIEIGTEELPAKELYNLSIAFYENIMHALHVHNIKYNNIINFSTARRLAIKIEKMSTTYHTKEIKKKGPSIMDAFNKDNIPSSATLNWCKSCNIKIHEAKKIKTNKGEWLYYVIPSKIINTNIILPSIIKTAINNIPISKSMRWNINNFKFSRPIRSITVLLGDQIIPIEIFGITSDRILRNHISDPLSQINIKHADQYPNILFKKSNIIAQFEQRKNKIIHDAQNVAKKMNGILKLSNVLLQEITALVESPNILVGSFNKKFLQLPNEILVYIMEYNQKYFPIYSKENKQLLPNFIFVSNIQLINAKNVILGNETVIHARFKDAEFFFNNDQKHKLEYYLPY